MRRDGNGQGSSSGAGGGNGAPSGSKVDLHAATSARRRGTSVSSTPSGSVVFAARLAAIPIPALRL